MRTLRKYQFFLLSVVVTVLCACMSVPDSIMDENIKKKKKILVFSKTKGFRHDSIEKGTAALKELGMAKKIDVDHSEDAGAFTSDNLKQYDEVVFLNTTGDILNDAQQEVFEQFIQAGGGFMGIHSAADTEYDWPWYNGLVGAYFQSHPKQQKAVVEILDKNHISTTLLPEKWERFDEWYNYKSISSGIIILANLDESTYKGGENGENHPIAWYQEYDGGKAFYAGGSHTKDSYDEPLFLKHLYGGLKYILGEE